MVDGEPRFRACAAPSASSTAFEQPVRTRPASKSQRALGNKYVSAPVAAINAIALRSKLANTVPPSRRPWKAMTAVGEVSPRLKHREAGLHRWTIDLHGRRRGEPPHGAGNIRRRPPIPACQYPDEFAQRRQGQHNDFAIPKQVHGLPRLVRIVGDSGADEDVRIRSDPQRRPAQPSAAISPISSIVKGFVPGR
jgi:hypothetical protein